MPLDLSLQLEINGITGIFGQSGSGKTSLLKAIAGINKQVIGQIALNEITLFDSSTNTFVAIENRCIVGVFQQDGLFPHLTVLGNLNFAYKRQANSKLTLEEIVDATEISHLLNHKIQQLSGGERQKVAIARALLAEPELLLLDEPVTALDKQNKAMVLTLIKSLQQKFSLPILYVSHSLDEIQALTNKLVVIDNGKVLHQGATHQVIHQLNHQLSHKQTEQALIEPQTSLTVEYISDADEFGLAELTLNLGASSAASSGLKLQALAKQFSATDAPCSCYILARDISISTQEPVQSSIVNQVAVTIAEIESDQNQVLITAYSGLELENKQVFHASITRYSLHKLALKQGQQIYLQFKASAIRKLI